MKGPEHKYDFVVPRFVRDLTYREPRWEQTTSEMIPATIAVWLNRVVFSEKTIDIRVFGFVHAAFFLIALYRILLFLGPFTGYHAAGLASVTISAFLILTDAGYVAYWNSLYSEAASCIWALFLIAETIRMHKQPGAGACACWSSFAVLLIMAKTQNFVLCLPLAIYLLPLCWRANNRATRTVALCGCVSILASGIIIYRLLQPAPKLTNAYNMIFQAILPESNHPSSDLISLELDPKYAVYTGTLAWSPNSGVADGNLVNAILAHITPFTIVRFYLSRPQLLWSHVRSVLAVSFSLRPDFCGNYEAQAGKAPGARSNGIALWSWVHYHVFSRIPLFLLFVVTFVPFASAALLVQAAISPARRRTVETVLLLSTCCLLAFAAAAFGDAWEVTKHQYLFNLSINTGLVWCLVTVAARPKLQPA